MKGGTAAIVVAAERIAALGRGRRRARARAVRGRGDGLRGRARAGRRRTARSAACGAVLVAEPTTNYPCVAHKGVVWRDAVARRADRPRLDAAPRRERDPQARAGDRAARRTSRSTPTTHPLLGAPDAQRRHRVGRDQHQLGARPRDGAGLDVRTVPGIDGDAVARAARGRGRRRGRASRRASRSTRSTPTPATSGCRTVFAVMGPLIGETPEPRGLAYFTDAAALVPGLRHAARRSSAAPATPSRPTAPTSRARWRRSRRRPRGSSRSRGGGAGCSVGPHGPDHPRRPPRRDEVDELGRQPVLHARPTPPRRATRRRSPRSCARRPSAASRVRVAGAGHSFTPVVETDGLLLDLSAMRGVVVDRRRAQAGARRSPGTLIHDFYEPLWSAGLALRNQGDIDTQQIAGAVVDRDARLGHALHEPLGRRPRRPARHRDAARSATSARTSPSSCAPPRSRSGCSGSMTAARARGDRRLPPARAGRPAARGTR